MDTFYNRALRYALLCALCGVWLPASANWQPTLAAAKNAGYREADEALRILIPPGVPVEELQTLALELDVWMQSQTATVFEQIGYQPFHIGNGSGQVGVCLLLYRIAIGGRA